MSRKRRGSRATRRTRRPLPAASTTILVGASGLVIISVVALSALLAADVSAYAAGLAMGVGLVGAAWGISAVSRRLTKGRVPTPGRSRTQDCRQARWAGPAKAFDAPRLLSESPSHSLPCPGTRRR